MATSDLFASSLPTSIEDVEPLTFERDIAPLKQQYFQQVMADPRMSFAAKMRASQMVSGAVDTGYMEARKVAEADREARQQAGLRNLQFQQTLFNLQKARDDAEQERRNVETFMPLAQQLNAITGDPNKSVEDKTSAITQFGINYAPMLSTNKPLEIAYNAALRGIGGQEKPQTFTIGSIMNSGVSLEDLKEAHRQANVPINTSDINSPVNTEVFDKVRSIQKQRQAEQEFQRNQQAKKEAAEEKEQIRVMEDLRNVKFTELKDLASVDSAASPQDFVPELTPQSSVIVSKVINQYGTKEDMDLYRKLNEENKKLLEEYRKGTLKDAKGNRAAISPKKGENDMTLFSLARDVADREFARRSKAPSAPSATEDAASLFNR